MHRPPRHATADQFPRHKGRCRFCHAPSAKSFCSDRCLGQFKVRRSAAGLRAALLARDKGVCRACGLDCLYLEVVLRRWKADRATAPLYREFHKRLGVPKKRRSYWDADHLIPVAEGGGIAPAKSVQTLCLWCHKNRTADQADDRAGRDRGDRTPGHALVRPVVAELTNRASAPEGDRL